MDRLTDAARHSERAVVAITHAFVIGWMVQQTLGAPVGSWMGLVPANTGLTVLTCAEGRCDLTAYNDTGHLAAGQN